VEREAARKAHDIRAGAVDICCNNGACRNRLPEDRVPRVDLILVALAQHSTHLAPYVGRQLELAVIDEVAMLVEERENRGDVAAQPRLGFAGFVNRGEGAGAQFLEVFFQELPEDLVLRSVIQVDSTLRDARGFGDVLDGCLGHALTGESSAGGIQDLAAAALGDDVCLRPSADRTHWSILLTGRSVGK